MTPTGGTPQPVSPSAQLHGSGDNQSLAPRRAGFLLRLFVILCCLTNGSFAVTCLAAGDELLQVDEVPWQFPDTGRIVVVGDLHGDFNRFVDILLTSGLIDRMGNWTGGATQLVQLGDINGKGDDTRLIMNLLMSLEEQARKAGGRVHTLLGNHDLKVV